MFTVWKIQADVIPSGVGEKCMFHVLNYFLVLSFVCFGRFLVCFLPERVDLSSLRLAPEPEAAKLIKNKQSFISENHLNLPKFC
jgi:hypothetical protein